MKPKYVWLSRGFVAKVVSRQTLHKRGCCVFFSDENQVGMIKDGDVEKSRDGYVFLIDSEKRSKAFAIT
jgi:hypothetical protein